MQTKLEEQTKMLEEQRSKNLELSERIANLVISMILMSSSLNVRLISLHS